MGGNTFGVPAVQELCRELKRHSGTLQQADLADIFTGRLKEEIPLCLDSLSSVLLGVRYLDLSDNAFGPHGAIPVAKFLPQLRNLQTLKLHNCGLGPQGGQAIAKALKDLAAEAGKFTGLETLVMGRNRLENSTMAALAEALKAHGATVKQVTLPQNGIRPEGIATLLSEGLRHCGALQVLDLQDNTFTEPGSRALAVALEDAAWPELQVLNVGDCLLGPVGSRHVMQALVTAASHPKALRSLLLQFNEMDEEGALLLAKALNHLGDHLECLALNGNSFNPEGRFLMSLECVVEDNAMT